MFELCIRAPQASIDSLSDAFEALDALSVSVEDADADTDAEQALFGEPGMPPPKSGWNHSHVTALFAQQGEATEAAALVSAQPFFVGCAVVRNSPVPDQDWVSLTQAQFTPVEITPKFWIVPTWHEPPEQARTIIRLDPGMAFGTGTHPTTRMCLRWLSRASERATPMGRVLDYGCGSGILAIAAAKMGAGDVDAIDIDIAAIEATRRNATANLVTLRAGQSDLATGRYDIVLANILASPLKVLAPLLCALVSPGGQLVLAGILQRQADELLAAYQPYARLKVSDSMEGWVLMTAQL